jgi:hypothetical protein
MSKGAKIGHNWHAPRIYKCGQKQELRNMSNKQTLLFQAAPKLQQKQASNHVQTA